MVSHAPRPSTLGPDTDGTAEIESTTSAGVHRLHARPERAPGIIGIAESGEIGHSDLRGRIRRGEDSTRSSQPN